MSDFIAWALDVTPTPTTQLLHDGRRVSSAQHAQPQPQPETAPTQSEAHELPTPSEVHEAADCPAAPQSLVEATEPRPAPAVRVPPLQVETGRSMELLLLSLAEPPTPTTPQYAAAANPAGAPIAPQLPASTAAGAWLGRSSFSFDEFVLSDR